MKVRQDVFETAHQRAHQVASCFHYPYYFFRCEEELSLERTNCIKDGQAQVEVPSENQACQALSNHNSKLDLSFKFLIKTFDRLHQSLLPLVYFVGRIPVAVKGCWLLDISFAADVFLLWYDH